jgi:hypothetical protein
MLDKLPLTADDTVVFLGDYIDRGTDARGVIDIAQLPVGADLKSVP